MSRLVATPAAAALALLLLGCNGQWSAPTTTTLAASPTRAVSGTAVTLTATVAATTATTGSTSTEPQPPAPTGYVTFWDGTSSLGNVPVSTAQTATLSVSSLSVATHNLYAVYSGDSTYSFSDSPALAVTVTGK